MLICIEGTHRTCDFPGGGGGGVGTPYPPSGSTHDDVFNNYSKSYKFKLLARLQFFSTSHFTIYYGM